MAAPQDSDNRAPGWLTPKPKTTYFAGLRRGITAVRWVLSAIVLVFGVYIFLTYGAYTVPGKREPNEMGPLSPDVEKGDSLLLQRFNLGRTPHLHDIVIYREPGKGADEPSSLIGRIAGLPGEKIERAGPTMKVGGREALSMGFDVGPQVKIKDGDVLGPGQYLVVVNTDAEIYPDSRTLGPIPLESMTQRMAMNITRFTGGR